MNSLSQTVNGLQEVLAVCPCCGEIFRLVEGKLIFPQKRPRDCEYTDVVSLEYRAARDDERLRLAEERFEQRLAEQRRRLIEQGRRIAKKKLRKIDPTFSGNDIDPQDVKLIFDPVEYVIFHGLCSADGVDLVELVSRSPESRVEEILTDSIAKSVMGGNVEFETLHMTDDGSFEIRKVAGAR